MYFQGDITAYKSLNKKMSVKNLRPSFCNAALEQCPLWKWHGN